VQRLPFSDYLGAPLDHWTSGEGWLHFSTTDPPLAGAVTWGTCGVPMCEALLACATASRAALPAHAALLDGSRTPKIEAISFRVAAEYVLRNREAVSRSVVRFAAVRPSGIAGASAEGFFRMVPAPYRVKVFDARGDALRWLGCAGLAPMIDEIESRAAASVEGVTVLPDLHRAIAENLTEGVLAHAAKTLGISTRSLQRRLRAEGTTFQRELSFVRLRAAQQLMLETDLPLTRIAAEAGFASASALSTSFRKHTGTSPSAWRMGRGAKE
jgi:AraC-like DNA-binding protein